MVYISTMGYTVLSLASLQRAHQCTHILTSIVIAFFWLGSTALAKPKSHILTLQLLLTRMLPGLRSLWMTPAVCRYLTPGEEDVGEVPVASQTTRQLHQRTETLKMTMILVPHTGRMPYSSLWATTHFNLSGKPCAHTHTSKDLVEKHLYVAFA